MNWLNSVDPSWRSAFHPLSVTVERIVARANAERLSGIEVVPEESKVFRAFTLPLDEVRVVILGQDPYPTLGHAVGLAFSVSPHTHPLPGSLRNILREWRDDLGYNLPAHGDLSSWVREGVLLLNSSLTTRASHAGAHSRWGWSVLVSAAIEAVAARDQPAVGVLWGAHAQVFRKHFGSIPIVESAHPSPLSAHRAFWGSSPFSKTNALLTQQGGAPLTWKLEDANPTLFGIDAS